MERRDKLSIRVRCHAKLNLFLKVFGKRPDGFHDIISVMQSVDLADTILIDAAEEDGIEITCSEPQVPTDSSNLVWRAAEVLAEESGREIGGLRFVIDKDIPPMAGLGGGSADAAGALAGLVRLWDLDVESGALFDLAARLGSDAPFCLLGGTAMAAGRGEKLEPLPVGLGDRMPEPGAFLLVVPPLRIETRRAYDALDMSREKEARKWENLRREYTETREVWQTAVSEGSFPVLFHNDFETPILQAYPELRAIHTHLRNFSGHAVLSGSGSCMFAYYERATEAHAACEEYSPVAGEIPIVALPVSIGIGMDE